MKIHSKLYSLAEIVAERPRWRFNIPIYQRLYVWGESQVRTLLYDLVNAYERGDDIFFLGGILLVEQKGSGGRLFDLIDGQQRFTTLWMLCYTWGRELSSFLTVVPESRDDAARPRLGFAIRPVVNQFLDSLAFDVRPQIQDVGQTAQMRDALSLMQSLFAKRSPQTGGADFGSYMAGLAAFVFKNVKFVITMVPRETDLNKLFEVINNRGVQLQHHEILKARMLDALAETERGAYAALWDACADMDHFVERGLAGNFNGLASELTACYEGGRLADSAAILEILARRTEGVVDRDAVFLRELVKPEEFPDSGNADSLDERPGTECEEPTWVRSIFGFPLFLQHVLRVWLLENDLPDVPRLLDRELLSLFEAHFFKKSDDRVRRAENARSFMQLLWRLRVIFDQYVIKWVDQGEEEIHLISQISVSSSGDKRYMSRSRSVDAHQGLSLLQSMLYHSQEITTQYWLTPLLCFIRRNPGCSTDRYFAYLRHLDNHLLCSAANETLVERSLAFMKEPWHQRPLIHVAELNKPNGVKFAHYWFYKIEFVLWFKKLRNSEQWRKFRLTAKSSVEHISPQTPTARDSDRVDQSLHCFGNLALVSRSLNSEYGNMPFNEKREKFVKKKKARLDSLKMDLIYESKNWGDDQAFAHQRELIECLDDYIRNTPGE